MHGERMPMMMMMITRKEKLKERRHEAERNKI